MDAKSISLTSNNSGGRKESELRSLFPQLEADDSEMVLSDYACALQKDILIQGRLYVTTNNICFHSNIFSFITQELIPLTDVIAIEKKFSALIIPNAILVSTLHYKYFFTSFLSRDHAYNTMIKAWKEYQRRPVKEVLKKSETVFSDDEEDPVVEYVAMSSANNEPNRIK